MGLDIHCLVPLSCLTSFKSNSGLIAAMQELAVPHTARRFGAKVAGVKSLVRISLAAGVFSLCLPVHSETLRCNSHIVETGDPRVSVRYDCGEPLLQGFLLRAGLLCARIPAGAQAICQLGCSLPGGQ